jgi:hypothetical protein
LYFIARQPEYLRTLNKCTENTHFIIKASKKYSYRDLVPVKGYATDLISGQKISLAEWLTSERCCMQIFICILSSGKGGGCKYYHFLEGHPNAFFHPKKGKKKFNYVKWL